MSYKSGNTLCLNGRLSPGCVLYDVNGNKLQIDTNLKNSTVDFIFGISLVQIVSPIDELHTLYGKIYLEIIQIRRHTFGLVPLEKYAFDTIAKNTNDSRQSNEYDKYFDMLPSVVRTLHCRIRIHLESLVNQILAVGIHVVV